MAQQWTHHGGGPGVVPLRPLGRGEILGGALTALGRHGGRLLGALLLGQIGGLLVAGGLLGGLLVAGGLLGGLLVAGVLAGPAALAAGDRPFGHALVPAAALFLLFGRALATALAAALLRPAVLGGPVTAPGLLRAAAPRVPAVLGAQLAALLAVAGPGAAALAAGLPPLTLLVLAPVSLWLGVLFALAPTAAGYEGIGPVAALGRSARLVRGAWWRTLGRTAPAWALALGAAYAAQVWFGPPGALLGAALLLTFPRLAAGLLYLDLRLRREHLTEVLAARPGVSGG
ncbi:hypothetical protein [Streptomyces sp. NBC_01408]|uniref:hypothetical protein n=1 Tax=Streptomyces sp. NBC_01408 TaxID=2903855 RepID=UPI00224CCEFB|nr:hypothetical protein [Streptomyces sp. NBC_01408]MCX4694015.1 hypothetical protein [Streptomyces sp. NBC_01408]